MKQNRNSESLEVLAVDEYLARRRASEKEKIKKEQEKTPEPFLHYSSFLLASL